jgi:DNA-binding XRE family transcriptional regulator
MLLRAFCSALHALESVYVSARNPLLQTPPYAVEQALGRLGENLKTARLRRGLTLEELAQKIGAGVRAVADAERGKPSTGIAIYVGLLWAFDLLADFELLADPARDAEGERLALSKGRSRARRSKGLDNDF